MVCTKAQGATARRLCYTVAALAMIASATNAVAGEDIVRPAPFEVHIELEKATYKLGEPFSFTVTANQDCYFLVFTIDPNDQVELHDPVASRAYMGHPLLKAGERREIPVPDAPGRAVITPPTGPYQMSAVCSREDLAKLGLNRTELTEPAEAGQRSFQIHLDEKLSRVEHGVVTRATVSYEVRP